MKVLNAGAFDFSEAILPEKRLNSEPMKQHETYDFAMIKTIASTPFEALSSNDS